MTGAQRTVLAVAVLLGALALASPAAAVVSAELLLSGSRTLVRRGRRFQHRRRVRPTLRVIPGGQT